MREPPILVFGDVEVCSRILKIFLVFKHLATLFMFPVNRMPVYDSPLRIGLFLHRLFLDRALASHVTHVCGFCWHWLPVCHPRGAFCPGSPPSSRFFFPLVSETASNRPFCWWPPGYYWAHRRQPIIRQAFLGRSRGPPWCLPPPRLIHKRKHGPNKQRYGQFCWLVSVNCRKYGSRCFR